ncbi:3-oxoadipate enol-lactonase [Yoonia sp. SS1-5]|uniref:3-oxoadipate enol-lactonase n=1 Tax=Yoonia rhodophyticola TaxID=3137370 RepID=A0AAN0MAD6_9RHOB
MQIFARPYGGLHWREDGDPAGMPLVFANSLGTDLRLWDPLLPHLAAGCRIIRYDLPGHGLSSGPDGPYAMEGLAQDAADLIEHLGISNPIFVGCSIGGMIGQALAATRPDLIDGLVLCNTAARMGNAAMWQDRIAQVNAASLDTIADAIMERWFSPAFRATQDVVLWRTMMARTSAAGYVGCCHALADADFTQSNPKLDMPVCAVSGELDLACPPDHVRATAASVKAASYHQIADIGHLPSIEAPATLGRLISDFIDEVHHDGS